MTTSPTLKQSEGQATASHDKAFTYAVWRLTGYYTFGAFVILVIFSLVVYALFIRTLPPIHEPLGDAHDSFVQEVMLEPTAHELHEQLVDVLVTADLFLLVITALFGYILSRATLAPIQHSYIRQRRFVAEAAHELRTPLSVMRAGADYLLLRKRPPAEHEEFTRVVKEEATRLTALTNDLLSLVRSDEGIAPSPVSVDLTKLTTHVATQMRWYAKERKCTIEIKTEGAATMVHGDKVQLTQLLMNLMKNAIDYNRPGGHVRVSLASTRGQAQLTIADTGKGIPEAEQQAVFERFYTLQGNVAGQSGGAGLGLSIVKAIVTDHKGTILLKSEPNKGTTIIVTLPLAHSS